MGSKKTITIFGILLILILVGGFFGIKYAKNKTQNEMKEYTPEQEITDEQSRQTIVSLFFVDRETGNVSIRSYNKFFNYGELKETRDEYLMKNLVMRFV